MISNKIKKKQIIYRSSHRGTMEMDLLLGRFVKKYIDTFSEKDLNNLEKILLMDDNLIQKWYSDKKLNDLIPQNLVSKKLKKFRL